MTNVAKTSPRVFAVVPAAGRSRRMGADKQLLEYAGRPMLRGLLETLEGSRVEAICLVTRKAISDRLDLAGLSKTVTAYNEDAASEMIDSIRIGIAELEKRQALRAGDGVLVCPGDHAGIAVAEFDRCVDAFRARPDRIVVAERRGRRGHPIIFPGELVEYVRSAACDGGLNALSRAYARLLSAVECESPGVTRDVDTPADYESLS